MRVTYRDIKFRAATRDIIEKADSLIEEYGAQGFTLTLRGLYYKFIGRDLFPDSWIDEEYNRLHGLPPGTKNTDKNYDRLGSIMTDARYGGLIAWDALNDVTRNIRSNPHWESPTEILRSAAQQFQIDKWEGQSHYVEVWIEKDALLGMVSGACEELDVPYMSSRGYTSATEMWSAAQRLAVQLRQGRSPVILHFGDHDPSGIDMSRDIRDRINEFFHYETGDEIGFRRLALNMDQIELYKPPPNPTKLTDCRARGYIAEYGRSSWEIEALEPQVMIRLIQETVEEVLDYNLYSGLLAKEKEMRDQLAVAALNWNKLVVPALARASKTDGRKGGRKSKR